MAFSISGWTPALLSLAKLRVGFMEVNNQEFNNLAEQRQIRPRLTFFEFKRPMDVILDNSIYVTVWLHIDGGDGRRLDQRRCDKGAVGRFES